MTDWPVHGRIDGPIVMIGFDPSVAELPLIERHFAFDRTRMVVIDPVDTDSRIARRAWRRLVQKAVTRENYRELLTPLLTKGGGQGFCVNLSVDSHLLRSWNCARARALYIDTVAEPWAGFYFDKSLGAADR